MPQPDEGERAGPGAYGAATHAVFNQPTALVDFNLFTGDAALQDGLAREGAGWAASEMANLGSRLGAAGTLELGVLANHCPPELDTHDRYGARVDLIRYHPAYHQLMAGAIALGLHASPWVDPRPGAQVARTARYYMQAEVEAGHGCPITMTFAATPCLAKEPALARHWLPKILASVYDPRNVPASEKAGLTIGMAMTEKQGGSDVRANTTRATPIGHDAMGEAYELVGHKFFVSAPMCDAFLTLAQAAGGLTCFLAPRWRPDGVKNPIEIVRLKRKMGNVANATSETEWRGALAWRVGPEGRGVATILEMVAATRFDCMIGSSAGMRMAVAQALDHCRQRKAFGEYLIDQPVMTNVLADLALEAEASLALTLRIARALDARAADESEDALARIGAALGKYWICKRAPAHAYEAMECLGGSGAMEDSPMPRLYRDAPINAIWEGSGNVQCLDVLRAVSRKPETLDACFAEIETARGGHPALDAHLAALKDDMRDLTDFEPRARDLCDRLALALQASAMVKGAPAANADAFCRSRLAGQGQRNWGALPRGLDLAAIVKRAAPR